MERAICGTSATPSQHVDCYPKRCRLSGYYHSNVLVLYISVFPHMTHCRPLLLQVGSGDAAAALKLLEAACSSNEISMQQVLDAHPLLLQQVMSQLTDQADSTSRASALTFFFTVSTRAHGRLQLCKCLQADGGRPLVSLLGKLPAMEGSSQVRGQSAVGGATACILAFGRQHLGMY
jgi:hypothetical protein